MQADTDNAHAVGLGLDACLAALRLLSAPGLDRQVVTEDALDGILAFLRLHMLQNVLVFYDGRLCQLHRPELNEQGEAGCGVHSIFSSSPAEAMMVA